MAAGGASSIPGLHQPSDGGSLHLGLPHLFQAVHGYRDRDSPASSPGLDPGKLSQAPPGGPLRPVLPEQHHRLGGFHSPRRHRFRRLRVRVCQVPLPGEGLSLLPGHLHHPDSAADLHRPPLSPHLEAGLDQLLPGADLPAHHHELRHLLPPPEYHVHPG